MMFSVWDPDAKLYDQYETLRIDAAPPMPQHLTRAPNKLGFASDDAAWPLPSDARFVGKSASPKGTIATQSTNALGDFTIDRNWLLYGAVAVGIYWLWKKNK